MPASTTERQWTTTVAPPRDQFTLWRDVAAEAWVPVDVTRDEPGAFPSSVAARRLGPLDISRIATPPQRVARTAAQVAAGPGDRLFLNLPLTPGSSARQDGRLARLGPGDFVVVDSARPFDLHFAEPLRQISVTVPHDALLPRLARPTAATGVQVRGDTGVGAVASAALRALATAEGLDRRAARALSEQVLELVALALGAAHVRGSRDLLLQAILDEVERSLGDPGLSPSLVADRVGISLRYLHRLLSDRGPSFGLWVRQRRLARAREELLDPESAGRSVADIAWHWGFADPSYFGRVFRDAYGVTPHQARGRR